MTWRERLALLLGAASPFAVTTPGAAAAVVLPKLAERGSDLPAIQPLEFWSDPAHTGHLLQLTGHSSHRSHSSHSSHSSHVSGSGHASHYSGTTSYTPSYTPAPVYSPPPPPPAALYTPPAPRAGSLTPTPLFGAPGRTAPAASIKPDRLSQDDITKFVQRVQIALMVKGYDPGPADGDLKPQTREALRAFQDASGLKASGNMDMDTLHALGVLK
jgi:His-Xaa-Ser repeat protein HxsA